MSPPTTTFLGIACRYLDTSQPLIGTSTDILNVRAFIVPYCGISPENCIILRDDLGRDNITPTKDNILKNIRQIAEKSNDKSTSIICFSGHGIEMEASKERNFTETDNKDSAIITSELDKSMGVITDNELYSEITQIKGKIICVFDCCNSGTVLDLPNKWIYDSERDTFKYYKENENNPVNKNIICLSAARDIEVTYDVWSNEYSNYIGIVSKNAIEYYLYNARKASINIIDLAMSIQAKLVEEGYPNKIVVSSSSDDPGSLGFSRAFNVISETNQTTIEEVIQEEVIQEDKKKDKQADENVENNKDEETRNIELIITEKQEPEQKGKTFIEKLRNKRKNKNK